MSNYLAITPARDEERFIPGLFESMIAQTVPPASSIVIDDGSSDRTPALVDCASQTRPWIRVELVPCNGPRAAGAESVVMRFLTREVWQNFDFVPRLDADLAFEPDLAMNLLMESLWR